MELAGLALAINGWWTRDGRDSESINRNLHEGNAQRPILRWEPSRFALSPALAASLNYCVSFPVAGSKGARFPLTARSALGVSSSCSSLRTLLSRRWSRFAAPHGKAPQPVQSANWLFS